MPIARFALAVLLAASPVSMSQAHDATPPPTRSATVARDVNGFALGMNIRDAAQLAPMQSIGNGSYQAVKDGIRYDLGVTRLGRIYRVDSEQDLGPFIIDDAFLSALRAKLTAKYGAPLTSHGETFGWSLIEPVKRTGDAALPFETNWASAYVDGGLEGVTLHIKLLDFRVMWQDANRANEPGRENAMQELRL